MHRNGERPGRSTVWRTQGQPYPPAVHYTARSPQKGADFLSALRGDAQQDATETPRACSGGETWPIVKRVERENSKSRFATKNSKSRTTRNALSCKSTYDAHVFRAKLLVGDEQLRPFPHLVAAQARHTEVQEEARCHRQRDLQQQERKVQQQQQSGKLSLKHRAKGGSKKTMEKRQLCKGTGGS